MKRQGKIGVTQHFASKKNNQLPQAACSDALACLLWISSGMDLNRGTQSENRNKMLHICTI